MIDFAIAERRPYKERRKKAAVRIIFVVGGLLIFSLLLGHDILVVSVILLFIFITQMYKSDAADRFFIKNLWISNEDVKIIYEDKGTERIFSGNLTGMTIKKENGFRTVYLSIYTENKLLLRQFIHGDWTEQKFDEIEQYIRKLEITGKEIR
jgi:hypothetical protein